MRNFNEEEKVFLRKLVEWFSCENNKTLMSFLHDKVFFDCGFIYYDSKKPFNHAINNDEIVKITKTLHGSNYLILLENSSIEPSKHEALRRFSLAYSLIMDLMAHHYIYVFVSENNWDSPACYAPNNIIDKHNGYHVVKLSDSENKNIDNYFFGFVYLSGELKEYVHNKFRTKEDIQFSNQQRVAWVAIVLALILGLLPFLHKFL